MSESTDDWYGRAAVIYKAAQGSIKLPDAMKHAGFSEEERKNPTVQQHVHHLKDRIISVPPSISVNDASSISMIGGSLESSKHSTGIRIRNSLRNSLCPPRLPSRSSLDQRKQHIGIKPQPFCKIGNLLFQQQVLVNKY